MTKYLTIALLFLFVACKKNEDGNPTARAGRISKVTLNGDGYTDQYLLSYNASGDVSKIIVSGSLSYTIVYRYAAQYKIATYESGAGFFAEDSTVLNNGKIVQNIHVDNYYGDTIITDYSYDNSGNLTQIVQSPGSTTYTWQGGNVVSSSSTAPQNTTSYTYDANSAFRAGDYMYVNDLIKNGTSLIANKNLLIGCTRIYTGRTISTEFVYDKDSKGRIIKCSEVEQPYSVGSVWTYEYND